MNRKTKDGCRANPGRRGRWAGTRPGTELSRATPCSLCAGSWVCLIGPTYHNTPTLLSSAALMCVCVHRKPVSPWTWLPSPRDWSSGGRHPAHRPWSWGPWASRGASDPETSRKKWPTARSAPPSVSPARTITDTVDFSLVSARIKEFKKNEPISWCKLQSIQYFSLNRLLLLVLQVFNMTTGACSMDNTSAITIPARGVSANP